MSFESDLQILKFRLQQTYLLLHNIYERGRTDGLSGYQLEILENIKETLNYSHQLIGGVVLEIDQGVVGIQNNPVTSNVLLAFMNMILFDAKKWLIFWESKNRTKVREMHNIVRIPQDQRTEADRMRLVVLDKQLEIMKQLLDPSEFAEGLPKLIQKCTANIGRIVTVVQGIEE